MIIWCYLYQSQLMKQNNYKFLLPLVATILMGLSTWVLIQVVELRTTQSMVMQELLNIDKQMGRIYAHMDRLMSK
jgi:sensor domain CHASE-containing protein